VLVAEDNKTNQLVIQKILERAGHSPHIVNNGQEALDTLERLPFDMIIMDMQMPVMGGIEAAKIYNFSTNHAEKSPIIILTANATTEALNECKDANIESYLTKPINVSKLLGAIDALSNKKAGGQSRKNPANTPLCNADDNDVQTLDYAVLEELKGLSTENGFLPTLINNFITDTEEQLKAMEHAVSVKSYESYREYVHALKGSAGSIGAMELHSVCKDELHSYNSDSEYINSLKTISAIFTNTKLYLCNYLKDNGGINLNHIDS
jgi:two-component system sensor histidine kinase RpfC